MSLVEKCLRWGQTFALAESVTGGAAAWRAVRTPGASAVFLGSVVAYHRRTKRDLLGISEDTLGWDGVNPATALALAQAARRLFQAGWGVGLTGLAGPAGPDDREPVGTVYACVVGPLCRLVRWAFVGQREVIQERAAAAALDLLEGCLDRVRTLGLI